MPYEVFLALRYLRSRRKRRLARATSVAAILGITFGVAALIVACALSNGFRDEMREKILAGTAHLTVVRSSSLQMQIDPTVVSRIKQIDGITVATTTTYDGALVRGSKEWGYGVLRGVENESSVPQQWVKEGSFASLFDNATQSLPKAVVGTELATRLGLKVGDTFQVIPASTYNQNDATIRRFQVAGIFTSGLYEYDSTWLYLSMANANAISDGNHAGSVLSVQVKDVDSVGQIAERIRRELGAGYTVVDWQQANQPLFAALALERRMGLFVIGLIIAIAVINISTMLILVVVERRRDIAILNALGATRNGIMLIFMLEGAIVGAAGALAGVVLGLLCCAIGNYFKLVSLPSDVYSISNVPLNAHIHEALIAALIAFALSVLATIYPARTAARMRPVETLRDAG